MSDDVLARASQALRERADGPAPQATATRARVLRRATRGGRRRRLALTFLPLAAVLAVSSAWAQSHGGLPRAWIAVEQWFGRGADEVRAPEVRHVPHRAAPVVSEPVRPVPTQEAPPEVHVEDLPSAAVAAAPLPEGRRPDSTEPEGRCADNTRPVPIASSPAAPPASAIVAAAPPPVAIAAPPARDTPTPSAGVTVPEPPAAAASAPRADDPEGTRLYAEAHRAHFVDRDPAAALRAWDAYLAARPDGVLAPEARYNRALTLVRLGRRDEAREALRPFAAGEMGGYRQKDAAALLDALAGANPPPRP
jgi:hypothetical protein